MFVISRKPAASPKPDRLITALGRVEARLQQWIGTSEANARLFTTDPMAAMRSAGLDIDDELMCELEMIMGGIARKLDK
jgi:hypothetical protein